MDIKDISTAMSKLNELFPEERNVWYNQGLSSTNGKEKCFKFFTGGDK